MLAAVVRQEVSQSADSPDSPMGQSSLLPSSRVGESPKGEGYSPTHLLARRQADGEASSARRATLVDPEELERLADVATEALRERADVDNADEVDK